MSRLATKITLTLVVTLTIVHHALSINTNDTCQCGIENKVARRIIGGHKVPPGKYPWMVLVRNLAQEGHCTGAIINDKFVLLADHCVDDVMSGDHPRIVVFHDQKHSNEKSISRGTPLRVKNVFNMGREGKPSKKNDIALLELEERLVFTKTFSPICLTPEIIYDNYFGAGWGQQQAPDLVNGKWDFSNADDSDIVLSEIPLELIRDKECSDIGVKVDYQLCVRGLKEGFIFSKKIKSNLCSGDSGGPLMTRGKDDQGKKRVYTLGVASTSDCNLSYHKFSSYEKIIVHKKWIEDHTKDALWCQGSSDFFEKRS